PPAIRLCLTPGNVSHRMKRLNGNPLIEMAALPTSICIVSPVGRMNDTFAFAPCPGFVSPKLPAYIAIIPYESRKFQLRYRLASDLKRRQIYWMSPFLIIEYEAVFRPGSDRVCPSGDCDISCNSLLGSKTLVRSSRVGE